MAKQTPQATRKQIVAHTKASTDAAQEAQAQKVEAADAERKTEEALRAVGAGNTLTGTVDPRDLDVSDVGGPDDKVMKDAQRQASQDPPSLGSTAPLGRRKLAEIEEVEVDVLRGYNFTDDSGNIHRYEAGKQKMPRSHAEHWFSVHHIRQDD